MVVFSKKKVIKKKSVNKKNKNKNTRVKRRVSRGKSRRRVTRKYVGGEPGDGNKKADKAESIYYKIISNNEASINLYAYIEDLVEVAYLAIVLIFLLCGPISADNKIEPAKKAVQTKLGLNDVEYSKVQKLVNTLLVHGVKVDYKLAKGKANGGALKGGGDRWKNLKKLLRIKVQGEARNDNRSSSSPSSPPPPYIDITYPSIPELQAMESEFDFFKLMLTTDKLMLTINNLLDESQDQTNSPSGNEVNPGSVDYVIRQNLANRSEINRHLLGLYNTTIKDTLPSFPNDKQKLAKQIAIDAVNYNLKNPESDKIVMSSVTKTTYDQVFNEMGIETEETDL